ncbi:MAG TPA: 2-oxo-4-hydroxy-4-carboxy-5-ureidoimidazoline decarboxylase [Bdellovibrionota bacterium]|jgi:2-oxo-4-hydroxy-4-carboxy-5-ureidoimidazoline decarboxylase|nr:2-oxo-4-hydroxy-4-carboxy-5-ureidoimidazoline decarboxylase [Bdellovibrionota bacterium]
MTLAQFNALSTEDAHAELLRCCGSHEWAHAMAAGRPYFDLPSLLARAESVWGALSPADWNEAFLHHPRIGESAIRQRFASTADWAGQEQRGVESAAQDVLDGLVEGNREYEERFGRIYLVCATDKSAREMLDDLRHRLHHDPEAELKVAAAEQAKITRLRLEKLLNENA